MDVSKWFCGGVVGVLSSDECKMGNVSVYRKGGKERECLPLCFLLNQLPMLYHFDISRSDLMPCNSFLRLAINSSLLVAAPVLLCCSSSGNVE